MKKNIYNRDFNLVDISLLLFKKRGFIITLTVIAMALAFMICKARTPQYTSKTTFIVKNPSILDRGYVFNTSGFDKNNFAISDDVEQVKSIAGSDEIYLFIIQKFNLSKVYSSKDEEQLINIVKGNLSLVMNDKKNIDLSYTDTDPNRAAQIANATRTYIEAAFLNYFISSNKDIINVLQRNTDSIQRKIVRFDDSIQGIRGQFSDVHQQLPSRSLSISTTSQNANAADPHLLERLNEVATIKDKLVMQIADYQYLLQQYYTITDNQIHLFYTIQTAHPKWQASSPKTLIIVTASAIAAMFFACLLIVFITAFQKVVTPQKSIRQSEVMFSE